MRRSKENSSGRPNTPAIVVEGVGADAEDQSLVQIRIGLRSLDFFLRREPFPPAEEKMGRQVEDLDRLAERPDHGLFKNDPRAVFAEPRAHILIKIGEDQRFVERLGAVQQVFMCRPAFCRSQPVGHLFLHRPLSSKRVGERS